MRRRRLAASSPFRTAFQAAATAQKGADQVRAAIAANDAAALSAVAEVLEDRTLTEADRHTFWRLAGETAGADILAVLLARQPKAFSLRNLCYSAWEGAVATGNAAAMAWLAQQEKGSLTLRRRADLAALAARAGHEALARDMIAPVCVAENMQPATRDKMVSVCLHACSGQGLTGLATELMQGYFYRHRQFFLTEHAVFRDIVMCAAVGGHEETLKMFLDEGAAYVTKDQLSQLLLASLSKSRRDCAELLLDQRADPLPYGSVCLRYAARMLGRALCAGNSDDVPAIYAVMEELLARGCHPAQARIEGDALPERDKAAVDDWLAQTLARQRHARVAALASAMPVDLMAPQDFRNAAGTMAWRESVLHQSVRHRVLDVLLAHGAAAAPTQEMWRTRNPSGQRMIDLAVASGQVEYLLSGDVWVGKSRGLQDFLAVLDDRVLDAKRKTALVNAVRWATIRQRGTSPQMKL